MTKDEALRAAEEAINELGVSQAGWSLEYLKTNGTLLNRIAQALLDAEKRERERCAKIAEKHCYSWRNGEKDKDSVHNGNVIKVAEAIRKGE